MPETTEYKAKKRDTFCSVGVAHGFPNCTELRKVEENKKTFDTDRTEAKDKWVLNPGDTVHIPKTTEGKEVKATGKQWDFGRPGEPPVSIRFVHGQPGDDKNCAMHPELKRLCISNYQTDKAGADRSENFPDHDRCGYIEVAGEDIDAFKVEVHDAQTEKKSLDDQVSIEALRPAYGGGTEATKTGEPTGWEVYDPTKTGAGGDFEGRKLDEIKARRMPELEHSGRRSGSKPPGKLQKRMAESYKASGSPDTFLAALANTRFRTCYLRLVVDGVDWNARKKQTLRMEPLVDTDDNKKIEILDHKVRATYVVDSCTSDPKCRAIAEVPVGFQKKRIKIAVHILRTTMARDSAGVVSIEAAEKFMLQYVRQFYAQTNMSFKFEEDTRLVQLPGNLFAISDIEGKAAAGSEKIKVKVKVKGISKDVEIVAGKIKAGDYPIKTANKLAKAIEDAFSGQAFTVNVRPSENPPPNGKAIGCADVLVGDPMTQEIELAVDPAPKDGSPNHLVTVARVAPSDTIMDFGDDEDSVGKIKERVLLKNCDTGSDRIDCIIVHDLDGAYGEGFSACASKVAKERPLSTVIHSAIITKDVLDTTTVGSNTWPHEFGHLLMDGPHADDVTELMHSGSAPSGKDNQDLDGSKRLADPKKRTNYVTYDTEPDESKWNSAKKVRTRFGTLLADWE